jgi:copper chaperone CopZ
MNTLTKNTLPTTEPSSSAPYWAEELDPRHARFRAKIGGLHCSLCTGTLEKALGRMSGVEKVAVSLTHEQALVEYDPTVIRPDDLLETLRDIGYQIWDPRKLRPFEEEESALVREGKRLLVAIGFSLLTIALILQVSGIWSVLVPLVIGFMFLATAFLILRGQGLFTAIVSVTALGLLVAAILVVNTLGIARGAVPWVVGAFAIIVVFGVAQHILVMAWQSLRRGILNQHVMLEAGAFAGIIGGLIGLFVPSVGYPAAPFFAVSVLVANYHIFSEWLSLLVKTRSSQAVKRLLDLQPDTARVVRGDEEREVPIGEVAVSDLVRVRPGERIPVDGLVTSGHSAVDQALALPHSMVDNSDFAPTRLTGQSDPPYDKETIPATHFKQRGSYYVCSCVCVPARSLPPSLTGTALASLLVPSSAFLLTRRGQAQHAPPSAQAPLPTRLPRLPSRLHCLVGWRASACSCTPLARGEKPAGSTQAREDRGLRLSQPAVPVLRHHRCSHPRAGRGWQAWPG